MMILRAAFDINNKDIGSIFSLKLINPFIYLLKFRIVLLLPSAALSEQTGTQLRSSDLGYILKT